MGNEHEHWLRNGDRAVAESFRARFWALSKVNLSCRGPPAEIAKDEEVVVYHDDEIARLPKKSCTALCIPGNSQFG